MKAGGPLGRLFQQSNKGTGMTKRQKQQDRMTIGGRCEGEGEVDDNLLVWGLRDDSDL